MMSQYDNDAYEYDAENAYKFTIVNGEVTAVYEWDDGIWQRHRFDTNESWAVNGNQIIKTEVEWNRSEISVFENLNSDGIYRQVSELNDSNDAYDRDHNTETYSETNHSWDGLDSNSLTESSSGDDNLHAAPLYKTYENGVSGYQIAQRFLGDASLNLHYQVIDEHYGTVLQGSESNDFIKLAGLGNKASDGMGGDDVLDGGVGSAFLTGGGNRAADTFFLDGRADGDAWSTITDFEIGRDKLTIWGWKDGVSSVRVVSEYDGAEGYKGLTLNFENLINDSTDGLATDGNKLVTLTGLSSEDFGFNSIDGLNDNLHSNSFEHAHSGSVTDTLGEHGYWQVL